MGVGVGAASSPRRAPTSSGVSSTRNAHPWLKPALGARWACSSIRSTTAGSTGSVGVAADHPATAYDLAELHGRSVRHLRRCPQRARTAGSVWDPRRQAGAAALTRSTIPMDWGMGFEEMWRDLAPVGRSASSGGYFRQPWTSAESELRPWFAEECAARGLVVETDGIGNQVAWWEPSPARARATRACSPARTSTRSSTAVRTTARWAWCPRSPRSTCCASAGLRAGPPDRRRRSSSRRRAPASGCACLGSRLATGAIDLGAGAGAARPRRRLPPRRDRAPPGWTRRTGAAADLDRVGTFVELHVEQGRDLVDRDVAVGLASEIWPHGRYRFDFAGQANHAGTTRMEDRHDPMLTYAMTALAANKQARLAGQRATFGRITVEPNGTNAVPSLVTAWLDARASSDDALADAGGGSSSGRPTSGPAATARRWS